jgi:hypothetical protein
MVRSCSLCTSNFVYPPKKFLPLSESVFPSTSSQTSLLHVISPLHIGRRSQVSLSYKTTRKICNLYVLIVRVLQDMSQVDRVRLPSMEWNISTIILESIAHKETTDITLNTLLSQFGKSHSWIIVRKIYFIEPFDCSIHSSRVPWWTTLSPSVDRKHNIGKYTLIHSIIFVP